MMIMMMMMTTIIIIIIIIIIICQQFDETIDHTISACPLLAKVHKKTR
jgi:hypothetical protein